MQQFRLISQFKPAGDQPQAIEKLVAGLRAGRRFQTLLGVTGSGKTFTMANVIQAAQKPTLVISHNKTLAAQLADELKEFFPQNAVHYFVSYYDYYQPEAYVPHNDTYIEKETQINEEIDRLRHAATQSLLTRRDVIIVASVSCIYGLGNPGEYSRQRLTLSVGDRATPRSLGLALVSLRFSRNDADQKRGTFRIVANHLDIVPSMAVNEFLRVTFGSASPPDSLAGGGRRGRASRSVAARAQRGSESIAAIEIRDRRTGRLIRTESTVEIFPATHYLAPQDRLERILAEIERDAEEEIGVLRKEKRVVEAARLEQRTRFDLEMIRRVGYCSGIENYSRYFDGREPGEPPYTLLDYFTRAGTRAERDRDPRGDLSGRGSVSVRAQSASVGDFLTFIDESHITIPQIGGMYEGDKSRKDSLVRYGFRMASAYDNRPLTFEEFEQKIQQVIFVSATPGPYEYRMSAVYSPRLKVAGAVPPFPFHNSGVVEQLIRPTGLLEPEVEIRKTENQIDDLMKEIEKRVEKNQRALVTTLTKRMAEDLAGFLQEKGMKVAYVHSEIDTLERLEIIQKLREGFYDCLVGINLLREGLDLPEVSLVAILDADKEGFLRSATSFVQIMGRAARHVEGRVIMYADRVTDSMRDAIAEVERRRSIQREYNRKHGIVPTTIVKNVKKGILSQVKKGDEEAERRKEWLTNLDALEAEHVLAELRQQMDLASQTWDFEKAAKLRDEIAMVEQKFFPIRTRSKFGNIKKAARGEL